MKKKMKLNLTLFIIVAITLILAGLFTVYKDQALSITKTFTRKFSKQQKVDTVVYFQTEDQMLRSTSIKIENGKPLFEQNSVQPKTYEQNTVFSVSPDRKIVAFTTSDTDMSVTLKNLEDNSMTNVDLDVGNIYDLAWSSDQKYLLALSITQNLENTLLVIDTTNNTIKHKIKMFGLEYYWVDETNIATNYATEGLPARPWLSGKAVGVQIVNIVDAATQKVVEPTENTDFYVIDSYQKKLALMTTFVANKEDWALKTPSINTGEKIYNTNNSELRDVDEKDLRMPSKLQILIALQKNVSPAVVTVYENQDFDQTSLATLKTGGSAFTDEIYLFDKSDLTKYQNIGTGRLVDWR